MSYVFNKFSNTWEYIEKTAEEVPPAQRPEAQVPKNFNEAWNRTMQDIGNLPHAMARDAKLIGEDIKSGYNWAKDKFNSMTKQSSLSESIREGFEKEKRRQPFDVDAVNRNINRAAEYLRGKTDDATRSVRQKMHNRYLENPNKNNAPLSEQDVTKTSAIKAMCLEKVARAKWKYMATHRTVL